MSIETGGEILGERCIDGGKCHHLCSERCFRRECCTHFSDYVGEWVYEWQESLHNRVGSQPKPSND